MTPYQRSVPTVNDRGSKGSIVARRVEDPVPDDPGPQRIKTICPPTERSSPRRAFGHRLRSRAVGGYVARRPRLLASHEASFDRIRMAPGTPSGRSGGLRGPRGWYDLGRLGKPVRSPVTH